VWIVFLWMCVLRVACVWRWVCVCGRGQSRSSREKEKERISLTRKGGEASKQPRPRLSKSHGRFSFDWRVSVCGGRYCGENAGKVQVDLWVSLHVCAFVNERERVRACDFCLCVCFPFFPFHFFSPWTVIHF
jgi:hypothetical protein